MDDMKKPASPPESMENMTVRIEPSTRAELREAAAAAGEEETRHARRMIKLGLQVSRMGLSIAESRTAAEARTGPALPARRRA